MTWTEEEVKHGFKGESSAKAEAAHWLELKAKGLLEDGTQERNMADKALHDVLPSKASGSKQPLALKDKSDEEKEEEDSHDKKAAKDDHLVEAEVLSEVGKAMPKKEAALRVTRMVKLLEAVRKDAGSKAKSLDGCLQKLEKLQKMGMKVNLEDAKHQLFDCALEIKKVKKN